MAISSGVGPHAAWINVGGTWPLEHGSVTQARDNNNSNFEVYLPMSFPGAYEAFSNISTEDCSINIEARGNTDTLIMGRIQAIRMDYISGTIAVKGQDKGVAIHHNKTSEKFINQQGHQVIKTLVGRLGLPFSGDQGSGLMIGKQVGNDYVKLADNVSYGYIIHKISEFDGSVWWVDKKGTFNYKQIGSTAQGGYTVTWQAPSPERPMRSDAMQLTVTYDVQATKTSNQHIGSFAPATKKMNKGLHTSPGRLGSMNYNHHIANLTKPQADQYAKSLNSMVVRQSLTVVTNVVGDPTIDIGQGLTLSGTGPFDQDYEIDRIMHTFGMVGYTMEITARAKSSQASEGKWAPTEAPTQQTPAQSSTTPSETIGTPQIGGGVIANPEFAK